MRFLRGVGWGALYGQWWTLWTIASHFFWNRSSESNDTLSLVIVFVLYALSYAFFGIIAGLVIAGILAPPATGAIVGVVVGLCVMGIEAYLNQSLGSLINVFFYFFTGRYIGANIAARVNRPVKI